MAQEKLILKVKVQLWLKIYIRTLCFFCVLFDCEPDAEKLKKMIRKGTKFTVAK